MFYLRRFPHPNIVTVFGGYEEDGKLYMVMEYMAHSLRSRSVVNRVDVVRVLSDVARALVRLHAAGHVHRDVKARNVLITRGYETAKLCDFGLARTMPDESRDDVNPELTPRIGPPKYRAPEVVKRRDYGTSSDMYGFGIMCQQLVKELKKKRRRAIGEEEVEFILNIASECLRKDPGPGPPRGSASSGSSSTAASLYSCAAGRRRRSESGTGSTRPWTWARLSTRAKNRPSPATRHRRTRPATTRTGAAGRTVTCCGFGKVGRSTETRRMRSRAAVLTSGAGSTTTAVIP